MVKLKKQSITYYNELMAIIKNTVHTSIGFILLASLLGLSALTIGLFNTHSADAASKKDWVTENIISDSSFTNKNAMSTTDIQSFLDAKIGSCDIWGTGKATEHGSNLTRAQYAKSRGWAAPPYICLNKYYEVPKIIPTKGEPITNFNKTATAPSGSKSAAWIIKDAANRYNISPRVLLVKIATESAGPLTSDNWPLFSQYKYAMGSHCPDSGPGGSANCDTSYAGFSIQMYSAAELMRSYLDNMNQPWWTLKRPGKGVGSSNYVGWNVAQAKYYSSTKKKWVACGGTYLNIKNKATAALYTYTPYQPNGAALDHMYSAVPYSNGYGSKCAAYGNRNFWRVYVDWFGNSRTSTNPGIVAITSRYASLTAVKKSALGSSKGSVVCGIKENGCYQLYQKGAIIWSSKSGAWESMGGIRYRWGQLGYENGSMGYPAGPEVQMADGGFYQKYQNGYIIWNSDTKAWESMEPIRERWSQLGYEDGELGYPRGPVSDSVKNGKWQRYQDGYILGTPTVGYWESKGPIRERWSQLGYETGELGYPASSITKTPAGFVQNFEQGKIYYESGVIRVVKN